MTAGGRIRLIAGAALTATVALSGATLCYLGVAPPPTLRAEATTGPSAPPTWVRPEDPVIAVAGSAAPTTLEIPAIGVRTALMPLVLRHDRTIEVPPLGHDSPAGWYRNGPAPGDAGRAVIIGHVDSARDGPAVFYRLRELTPRSLIRVQRADGSEAVFTVTRSDWYPKDSFPTLAVYGPSDRPELRLVTCGGSYDRIRRSYRENLVVSADLLSINGPAHPTRQLSRW
jgi:sortase (surface protein transpeptidase)